MKNKTDRRSFIRTSLMAGTAIGFRNFIPETLPEMQEKDQGTCVSLTSGEDRADMVFRALRPFSEQIKNAIGNRLVVLKPNNVLIYVPLASTHVETLEGILEFLKSIKKTDNVIIAESTASGSTLEGFDNYGYSILVYKYGVKLVDLDNEQYEYMYVTDQKDYRPHPIKVSKIITDKDSYVVSVARMKTHNTVVATLSLKNIILGSPIKDKGFTLYNEDIRFSGKAKESRPGSVSYKRFIHGSGFHAINYNMAMMAQRLHPDLAVIDGHTGMEHNGPTQGTPVDHRVCVVSPDWLAADRVGVELMGIDFSKIGYLNHCALMGLGNADPDKIRIIGEKIKDHIVHYALPDNYEKQTAWINPL